MNSSLSNLVNSIQRACWDAEIVWLATSGEETFVDFEPPGHADRAVAHALSITLARHSKHPELRWQQILRNLGEES
jgi:hypothetical protein